MILRYRAFFDDFSCVGGDCTDSCCKEWEVQVDRDTAAVYRSMAGTLGDDLRKYLFEDEEGDTYLRLDNGRCPMWRADGLCRIQAEQGHGSLCQTCRDFPRLTHDYGDFVERGLELSCPEAARLIFEGQNDPWVEREISGGELPDHAPEDMDLLLQTRQKALEIIADGNYSVEEALALTLLYGYHAQSRLDGEEGVWSAEKALDFARTLAKPSDPCQFIEFYGQLDILTEAWKKRLASPMTASAWDQRLRILAQYGIERYWLQAISDFDLVGRVKMVVCSCVLVHLLGGDLVATAQLYAKEIENSEDNVEAILDGAYGSPALTDDKILGLLFLSGAGEAKYKKFQKMKK